MAYNIYSKAGTDEAISSALADSLPTAPADIGAATAAQGALADATTVEQVTLTAPLAYTLPTGTPAGVVHRVVFTQDGTGGHTVTYGGAPVTVDTTAGASALVEIWPGGTVVYPGSSAPAGASSAITVDNTPTKPAEGRSATYFVTSAVTWPDGLVWSNIPDGGVAPTITAAALVSLFTAGGVTMAVLGATYPDQSILVSDSFTRDDDATGLGTAETGGAWANLINIVGVKSNQAYSPSNAGLNGIAVVDAGTADVAISVDLTYNTHTGIYFRVTDSTNYMYARISSAGLAVFSITNGNTPAAIGPAHTFTPVANTVYALKVVLVGSSIKVYLDGINVISTTSTRFLTATKHGVGIRAATTARADNFLVKVAA